MKKLISNIVCINLIVVGILIVLRAIFLVFPCTNDTAENSITFFQFIFQVIISTSMIAGSVIYGHTVLNWNEES